jgi:putative ABC transport system permease protein
MEIRPILSTLRRHKTAAALIVLEIALSSAIICNAVFLISTRLQRMERPTGLAESEIVRINTTGIGRDENADARAKEDVAALRSVPGVIAATSTNHVPFDNSSWNSSVNLQPDQQRPNLNANVYLGDEQLLETFGLRLVEGRDFEPGEYVDWDALNKPGTVKPVVPAAIVTRRVAEELFPGQSAVGKAIYSWNDNNAPHRIVGVVEHLIRTNDNGGAAESQYAIVLPIRVAFGRFALRTAPERRDEVQKAAIAALERSNPSRIVLAQGSFEQVKADWYRQDRAMAWLLIAVCVALLVVTALGIVGLASFWVQQRTKQIGIRRALGATRGQILRYFQTENFLLASIGIVLGMLLAYAINQLLMGRYELPRLPLYYLPVGAVALWLLGQVAVFWPARRAAAIPPALATRSV